MVNMHYAINKLYIDQMEDIVYFRVGDKFYGCYISVDGVADFDGVFEVKNENEIAELSDKHL